MKETILRTPKTLSFSKRIVKHLPQAVRNGLPAEISVVSVSEKESVALNRRYRKKFAPANVLSFLYASVFLSSPRKRGSRKRGTGFPIKSGMIRNSDTGYTYGEIIVCPSVIRREAREQNHTFDYQMTWMVAHGMIHLSGLHHEQSEAEERKFFAAERNVLDKIFNGAAKHRYGG